jgi:adenine-specific DNA-methyltransferase
MRQYIIKNKYLKKIVNFGHKQIFNGFTTYSCITLLDKSHNKDFCFYDFNELCEIKNYDDFYFNDAFYFSGDLTVKKIISCNINSYCIVKNGCATLLDKFFINNPELLDSKYNIPIIKASTGERYTCFFPYNKTGELISFDEIQKQEKVTADYLTKNRFVLEKRSIEKVNNWYGFGRNQAISDVFKNKIAINNVYKDIKDIKISVCESGCAVYSGFYILTNKSLDEIKSVLLSDDFIDYLVALSKYKSGNYYTISSKELEKFLNYKLEEVENGRQ